MSDLFIFHQRKVKILLLGFKVARVPAHRKQSMIVLLTSLLILHQIVVNVHIFIHSFWSSCAPRNSSLLILFYNVDFGEPKKDEKIIITYCQERIIGFRLSK